MSDQKATIRSGNAHRAVMRHFFRDVIRIESASLARAGENSVYEELTNRSLRLMMEKQGRVMRFWPLQSVVVRGSGDRESLVPGRLHSILESQSRLGRLCACQAGDTPDLYGPQIGVTITHNILSCGLINVATTPPRQNSRMYICSRLKRHITSIQCYLARPPYLEQVFGSWARALHLQK